MRELLIKWLREGMQLQVGEELYIPTDNLQAQRDFYKSIRNELNILRQVEPQEAAKLRISTNFKDNQFWVVIKKIAITPLTAFKKDSDGIVSRVIISNDKDKLRMERLKEADHVKKTVTGV